MNVDLATPAKPLPRAVVEKALTGNPDARKIRKVLKMPLDPDEHDPIVTMEDPYSDHVERLPEPQIESSRMHITTALRFLNKLGKDELLRRVISRRLKFPTESIRSTAAALHVPPKNVFRRCEFLSRFNQFKPLFTGLAKVSESQRLRRAAEASLDSTP